MWSWTSSQLQGMTLTNIILSLTMHNQMQHCVGLHFTTIISCWRLGTICVYSIEQLSMFSKNFRMYMNSVNSDKCASVLSCVPISTNAISNCSSVTRAYDDSPQGSSP